MIRLLWNRHTKRLTQDRWPGQISLGPILELSFHKQKKLPSILPTKLVACMAQEYQLTYTIQTTITLFYNNGTNRSCVITYTEAH
jgi:hypothetical protein